MPLPSAGWYDYWTGARLDTAATMETPQLDRLPVFVRPGAILPKQPLIQSLSDTPSGQLELHVYPGPDCHGSIYLDDGESYGYTQGQYLRQAFQCSDDGKTLTFAFDKRDGSYKPWWAGYTLVIHGWSGKATAKMDRKTIAAQSVNGTLTLVLPDVVKATTLAIDRAP